MSEEKKKNNGIRIAAGVATLVAAESVANGVAAENDIGKLMAAQQASHTINIEKPDLTEQDHINNFRAKEAKRKSNKVSNDGIKPITQAATTAAGLGLVGGAAWLGTRINRRSEEENNSPQR